MCHWIVGILSFQKMYGLYGLKHHTVDLLSGRFLAPTNGLTNRGIPRGPRGPKNRTLKSRFSRAAETDPYIDLGSVQKEGENYGLLPYQGGYFPGKMENFFGGKSVAPFSIVKMMNCQKKLAHVYAYTHL